MKQLFAVLAAIVLVVVVAQGAHLTGSPAISATPLPSPSPACGTALYTPTPNSAVASAPMAGEINHAENCAVRTVPSQNALMFGLKCDGITDDSLALAAAPFPVSLPISNCFVNESFTALPDGRFSGFGQLLTRDSGVTNQRAYDTSTITGPVTFTGSESSFSTAFNGDCTHAHLCWETYISGTATLGEPTSGFSINPMTSGVYGFVRNTSGWNNSTSSDIGRTATVAYRTDVYNTGQGGVQAYNCNGTLGGALAGATSFLANPSAECIGGQIVAIADGVYLNPYEIVISDQGHDAAGIGIVDRLNRTNATGALGTVWQGMNIQSEGSSPIDSAISVTGPATQGFDLSAINGGASTPGTSVFSFAANNYIYPNATNPGGPNSVHFSRYTVPGTTSWGYNSTDSAIETTVGGTLVEQATSTYVHLPSALNAGHLFCTPSASVSCTTNPTAVVFPGAHCYANYDSSTVALQSTLLPVVVQIVGTTLTLCPQTTTAQSNLLSMTYSCI